MKKNGILVMITAMIFFMQTSTVWGQEKKWFEDNRLVAHALGSVEENKETNSKEAFLTSWGSGIRVMEADFSMTADGTLVVRHDFDQDSYYTLEQKVIGTTDMNIDRYQQEKINFRYTPLTAAQLIQMMTEYQDVYVVTDTKSTDINTIKKQFQAFVDYAKNVEHPEVLDRLVVQIYNPEMYTAIQEIHPFQNWIYTLYQTPNPDYPKIAQFCVSHGIDVVTVNQEIVQPENIAVLNQQGLKVYAHTVNRLLDFQKMLQAGCYGIYTDYIKPNDLPFIGLQTVEQKSTKQIQFEDQGREVAVYDVLGKPYLNLRDMALLLRGTEQEFSVSFDRTQNDIGIHKGQEFIGMGNELLLGTVEEPFIEKCSYTLSVDGEKQRPVCYFIQDELYYEPQTLANALGLEMIPTETGYTFQTMAIEEK